MRSSFFTLTALAALAAPIASALHIGNSNHHRDIAHRAPGEMHVYDKRFSNTRFTYYDVGLGACGKYNVASDFIVALNSAQFGGGYPGPHCFQTITISYGGKSTQATIMDECPGCPYGGLDLSRGLFDFFASESMGVLYGSWNFNGGSGGGGGGDPPPHTTTHKTTHYDPPPTSTWTPKSTTKTTHTYTPPTTTSTEEEKKSSSSSSSSSSTHSSSSSSSSHSSTPSSTPTSDASKYNIVTMNQAVMGIGGMINSAGQAN